MAEILESMGFPKDLCELALSNSSGIEAAIDLILSWQTCGPPATSSDHNSRLQLSSAPVLRLSPSSTIPSEAQLNSVGNSVQVPDSFVKHTVGYTNCEATTSDNMFSRFLQGRTSSDNQSVAEAVEGGISSDNQSVTEATLRSSAAEPSRHSGRAFNNGEESGKKGGGNPNAVVPDLIAEERKRRTAAALLAKKEKESEKARIRKQLQEDRETRNERKCLGARSCAQVDTKYLLDRNDILGSKERNSAMVELQIRCQYFPTMKASFNAEACLKDVREYVEQALDRASLASSQLDAPPYLQVSVGLNQRWAPFSGAAAKLNSMRNEEVELLQAARDNFRVQTNRLIAEARALRKNDSTAITTNPKRGKIYFLVPVPRREFFTESSLEITLSQAQLSPKGTVIVHFHSDEKAKDGENSLGQALGCGVGTQDLSEAQNNGISASESLSPRAPRVAVENSGSLFTDVETRSSQQRPGFSRSNSDHHGHGRVQQDGQAQGVRGNQVKMRELALQAAANRMKEAANFFREGLPPEKGGNDEVFQRPSNSESSFLTSSADSKSISKGKVPAIEPGESLQTITFDADLPSDDKEKSMSLLNQGARDLVRSQAMLAAEARLRAAQCQAESPMENQLLYSQVSDQLFSAQISEQSRGKIPASSRLLRRPEKMQKMMETPSNDSKITNSRGPSLEEYGSGCSLLNRVVDAGTSERRLGSTQCVPESSQKHLDQDPMKENVEGSPQPCILQDSGASSSQGFQGVEDHFSTLRIRLEDGSVITHKCTASTQLSMIRDSVIPDGADPSDFGFVLLFPEPCFMTGDALLQSVIQVGLVPRGALHLSRISARGTVRQGGRNLRRQSMFPVHFNDYSDTSEHSDDGLEDLSYEAIENLQESIGRVCVGVPETIISALPTHVKERKSSTESEAQMLAGDDETQLCIVCIEELLDGDLVMSLPCLHAFHSVCISQWLRQSRSCPTCKCEVC